MGVGDVRGGAQQIVDTSVVLQIDGDENILEHGPGFLPR
jgi:hypothetical protein